MNDVNLSLYRIFYAVAQTGNISKAANELYISQPAISKAISKLEENLNITLFIRKSRGVMLTKEGEILLDYIKSAFQALSEGEDAIKKINEFGIGHLTFGVSTTLCKYMLLHYLEEFTKAYPHIRISIRCQSTFETLKLIEDHKVDIGLVGKPNHLKNIEFEPVKEIEDVFVANHIYLDNLLMREKISSVNKKSSPKILETSNLMLLDEKNITRIFIDEYMKKYNIVTNQILEVSNMDLLIEFSKIGLGIGCVIKEFVQDELNNGTLVEIPLLTPISRREVGFAVTKLSPQNDSLVKFMDFYHSKLQSE